MESKGVAIPYIIALVIGIIVLVFVVYWVYRMFAGPGGLSKADCERKFIDWCRSCAIRDWPDEAIPTDVSNCLSAYPEIAPTTCNNCNNVNKDECCYRYGIR